MLWKFDTLLSHNFESFLVCLSLLDQYKKVLASPKASVTFNEVFTTTDSTEISNCWFCWLRSKITMRNKVVIFWGVIVQLAISFYYIYLKIKTFNRHIRIQRFGWYVFFDTEKYYLHCWHILAVGCITFYLKMCDRKWGINFSFRN